MVLFSAVRPLIPSYIKDATGESVNDKELQERLDLLTAFIHDQTQELWEKNKSNLELALKEIKMTSPADAGRQANINPDLSSLPREVKAKSRIERLIRYNLITGARSYYESSNKMKQEPSFPMIFNLGAVDKQMAELNHEGNKLILKVKIWDQEYNLEFAIPHYLLQRDIVKFTLPVIRKTSHGYTFGFALQERPAIIDNNHDLIAGVDLGRVEPFTLAILHKPSGSLIAQYTSSKRLKILTQKRERLNIELKHLQAKHQSKQNLGLDTSILETEYIRTKLKYSYLVNAITWQIATEIEKHVSTHNPSFTNLENLSWVNAKHGTSKWTHSKDQTAITHKLTRAGHKVRKVNPRDTSQLCNKCGTKIIHRKGTRQVVCSACSMVLDRDVNAAINIAARSPQFKRNLGNNPTFGSIESSEVVTHTGSSKNILLSNFIT